ncbi:MAG: pyridoxal phosphate-dependent aminotransferase [Candidatus Acidiferrales bacterium]
MTQRREIRSAYMEWAKLRSHARFNLAVSGMPNLPLAHLRAALEDIEITGPTEYGYEPLQKRLAVKCGVAPENVVAATGTSMANHLALAALIEPGDEILVEEPTYELLLTTAEYLGAKIRRFPRPFEGGFQVDPREIERAITPRTRVVVLTNLHNPSGARTPDSILRLVGEITRSHGAHVLVDEVYLEACYDPAARSAFHIAPNFIVTSSLTKAYGLSGLRCGWILAAPALAERMWRLNDLFGVNAAHSAERLSVIALDHLPELAAQAKAFLEPNRVRTKEFVQSRDDLFATFPDAGTIVFPQLARGRSDAFCQLLREKYETSVVPGRFFEMPDHIRVGFCVDPQTLDEGLRRIGAALDEYANSR